MIFCLVWWHPGGVLPLHKVYPTITCGKKVPSRQGEMDPSFVLLGRNFPMQLFQPAKLGRKSDLTHAYKGKFKKMFTNAKWKTIPSC